MDKNYRLLFSLLLWARKTLKLFIKLEHKIIFFYTGNLHIDAFQGIYMNRQLLSNFTFVSPLLRKLDIVRVRLKYPNSPPTDPLRWSAFSGGLAQPRDLGGRSRHAAVRRPGLYACNKWKLQRCVLADKYVINFLAFSFNMYYRL